MKRSFADTLDDVQDGPILAEGPPHKLGKVPEATDFWQQIAMQFKTDSIDMYQSLYNKPVDTL